MSSLRAVVAVSIVLSGVRTVAADVCEPRAEVTGDAAAVAQVTAELARLGVKAGRPAPGCRGVVAQVELDVEGGVAVAVRDGSRRSEGRVVGDAAIAAAWIDSWLHDDLDGTAWLVATPSLTQPRVMRAAAEPTRPERGVGVPDQTSITSRPMLDRFAVTVAYEQSWLDDGESATGASGAMCLRVGRACLGARARYAREGDHTVNLTAMSRSDASILAIATVPFAVGRMTIAPELGLGLGRQSTRRLDGCPPPPMCDPNNPNDPTTACDTMAPAQCIDANGKTYVGDTFDKTTYTPRIAAALRIAIPLFDHVWLDGLASVTFAPFGHTGSFGVAPNADGTNPGNLPAEDLALPGEARGALHLGVGLRFGAP